MDDDSKNDLNSHSIRQFAKTVEQMRDMKASIQAHNSITQSLKAMSLPNFGLQKHFLSPTDQLTQHLKDLSMITSQNKALYEPLLQRDLIKKLAQPHIDLKASLSITVNALSSITKAIENIRTDTLLKASFVAGKQDLSGITQALAAAERQTLVADFSASIQMTSDLKRFLRSDFVSSLTQANLFDDDLRATLNRVIEVPEGEVIEAQADNAIDEPCAEYQGKIKLDFKTFKLVMEWLAYLVLMYEFFVMVSVGWDMINEYLDDTDSAASLPQAKYEARKAAKSEWDAEALKHVRVTSGENVRLRVAPSLSSDIITELPKFKWLNVIDKSNRTWLQVNVKLGDEVFTGWISRRYTKHLH